MNLNFDSQKTLITSMQHETNKVLIARFSGNKGILHIAYTEHVNHQPPASISHFN